MLAETYTCSLLLRQWFHHGPLTSKSMLEIILLVDNHLQQGLYTFSKRKSLTFPDFFQENDIIFPDYYSEMYIIFPDHTVLSALDKPR